MPSHPEYKRQDIPGYQPEKQLHRQYSKCHSQNHMRPQDNASTFSGICSKAIKSITPSTDGAVMVWSFEALTLKLYEETGEVFQVDNCEDWCVKISPTLKKRLHLLRREKLPEKVEALSWGYTRLVPRHVDEYRTFCSDFKCSCNSDS